MFILRKFIILLFFVTTLNSYELEDKLKVIITSKIAKFVQWDSLVSEIFTITVFRKTHDFFDTTLDGKKINGKNIKIVYIDSVNDLKDTNILYLSNTSSQELLSIFQHIKNKNILTISDIRGFAQKGGMIQLYTKNQNLKLRINLDNIEKENLKIKSSLLRISDVIQENKNEKI